MISGSPCKLESWELSFLFKGKLLRYLVIWFQHNFCFSPMWRLVGRNKIYVEIKLAKKATSDCNLLTLKRGLETSIIDWLEFLTIKSLGKRMVYHSSIVKSGCDDINFIFDSITYWVVQKFVQYNSHAFCCHHNCLVPAKCSYIAQI